MISSVKAEASASRPPNPFRSRIQRMRQAGKDGGDEDRHQEVLMTKTKAAVIAMTSPSRKPLRNRAWSLMRTLHPV